MKLTKVYNCKNDIDGIISVCEAKSNNIKLNGLHLASISTLQNIADSKGIDHAYNGMVKCKEGIFKFNFDNSKYVIC